MRGAIAAGHPLTVETGARVLAEGGNAVDACIAAAFVAAVAEGPLTGPAGGGFLLVAEPGRDDRHPDLAREARVHVRAEDDVRLVRGRRLDDLGRVVDLDE